MITDYLISKDNPQSDMNVCIFQRIVIVATDGESNIHPAQTIPTALTLHDPALELQVKSLCLQLIVQM